MCVCIYVYIYIYKKHQRVVSYAALGILMPRHAAYSYRQSDCSVTSTMLALINAFSPAVSQVNLQKHLAHCVGVTCSSCKHTPLFLLETSPGVTEVTFVEKEPAERHTIISWEQVSIFMIILQ